MQSTNTNQNGQNGLLKIGDFADLAGTNLRTLRYYEEIGLFAPAARSTGGFRYYRQTDVNRLRMVQSLQELGLPLERIRELMTTRENGDTRVERVRAALAAQGELLRKRIGELEAQEQRTQQAMTKLETCAVCDHHPTGDNNYCEPCAVDGRALPEALSALF